MIENLIYKGYIGSVEFSEDDGLFYGKVQDIPSLISYEGATVAELTNDFQGAVDDYIAVCNADWSSIPAEAPDDIDLQMLKEIEENPDCHTFIPASEAEKILQI